MLPQTAKAFALRIHVSGPCTFASRHLQNLVPVAAFVEVPRRFASFARESCIGGSRPGQSKESGETVANGRSCARGTSDCVLCGCSYRRSGGISIGATHSDASGLDGKRQCPHVVEPSEKDLDSECTIHTWPFLDERIQTPSILERAARSFRD